MSVFKSFNSSKIIPIDIFNVCEIDGATKKQIASLFPARADGAYYLDKFINYLKKYHNISVVDYIEQIYNEEWPLCPISKKQVGFKVSGKGLILSRFKKGALSKECSPAFNKACEKMSQDRLGKKNPMYGKIPWNSGLTKESNDKIKEMGLRRRGTHFTEEHKNKLRKARAEHPLKIRHTQKHSEESKAKMREATINRWKMGEFSYKTTSIEKKVEKWLKNNNVEYIFQYSIAGFVADFACVDAKILIECQGDFFHCNPSTKHALPKYEVQKRNVYRDRLKKQKYKDSGWKLVELWESQINSGEYKKILECKLKK